MKPYPTITEEDNGIRTGNDMAAPNIPYPSFNDVLFKIQENVDGDPAILRSTAAKALELVDEKKVLLSLGIVLEFLLEK